MSKLLVVMGIAALIAGCAALEPGDDVFGPDVHRIDCSGKLVNINHCHAYARDICGEAGYVVLSQREGSGVKVGKDHIYLSHEEIRRMTIRCKGWLLEEEAQVDREADSREVADSQE